MLQHIKASLKLKLVCLLVAIIVTMVSMIGFFSYYDTSRTIRKDISHYSEQTLHQASLNLNRQYMEYERSFLILGTSVEFTDWLQVDPANRFELVSGFHSLEENYLRSMLVRHPEILSISMLSDKGGDFNYTLSAELRMGYSLSDEPWLGEVDRLERVYHRVGPRDAYISRSAKDNKGMLLTMAGQLGVPEGRGFLKMDISLQPAQAIFDEMDLGEDGIGLIAKSDGTILIHQDAEKIGSMLESDIMERLGDASGAFFRTETDQLIVFDTIPYTGWKTVAILPGKDISASIGRVRNVTILIASLGTIAGIALVVWVAASVTRRLSKLRSYMKQAQIGNFRGRIPIEGTDEVADLGHSFNRMLEELDHSILQLTETKLMQQRAAFSAMQSQIHSHFLYNTLESINSMAHLARHYEIERATISLSRMLRYTSNFKDAVVRLQDEITHLDHYLNICRIRFREAVEFRIDVADECLAAACPKVILQPLAENAIKHGIETTGYATQLAITVRREDNVVAITIEDNGKECDEERLETFRQRLIQGLAEQEEYTTLKNVGLLNVHFRLQSYFQTVDAGVRIEQGGRLGGVKVVMRFPYHPYPSLPRKEK